MNDKITDNADYSQNYLYKVWLNRKGDETYFGKMRWSKMTDKLLELGIPPEELEDFLQPIRERENEGTETYYFKPNVTVDVQKVLRRKAVSQ
jgi:hypothetical protein